jgi:hypothetical protein
VRLMLWSAAVLYLGLAGCTRALSDADLLNHASSPFDKGAMEGKRIILGMHEGVAVVADFPCADLCPNNTVRVIHYEVTGEADCAQIGGLVRTLWVPEGIGNVPRIYCLPRVLAAEAAKEDSQRR